MAYKFQLGDAHMVGALSPTKDIQATAGNITAVDLVANIGGGESPTGISVECGAFAGGGALTVKTNDNAQVYIGDSDTNPKFDLTTDGDPAYGTLNLRRNEDTNIVTELRVHGSQKARLKIAEGATQKLLLDSTSGLIDGEGTLDLGGDLTSTGACTIGGDLTVNGDLISLTANNITTDDVLVHINDSAADLANSKNSGIQIGEGGGAYGVLLKYVDDGSGGQLFDILHSDGSANTNFYVGKLLGSCAGLTGASAKDVRWAPIAKAADAAIVEGLNVVGNLTGNTAVTLDGDNFATGEWIKIKCGTVGAYTLTITTSNADIDGSTANLLIESDYAAVELIKGANDYFYIV